MIIKAGFWAPVLLALGLLLSSVATAAEHVPGGAAGAPPSGSTITVLVKPVAPFIMGEPSSEPSGFSADLWRAIAAENEWTTKWEWTDTVKNQLNQVEAGKVDVGVAAISMTPEREQVIDFSLRMFSSGMQIMTHDEGGQWWRVFTDTIFNPTVLRALLVV